MRCSGMMLMILEDLHIFDTETLTHFHVNNPYRLFYNIYYEDTPHQLFDFTEYNNKIVKVIVRKKTNKETLKEIS